VCTAEVFPPELRPVTAGDPHTTACLRQAEIDLSVSPQAALALEKEA
jgi:hypothetical protein